MKVEYRLVYTSYMSPGIQTLMNEAADEGWRFVALIDVRHYNERTEYTVLMERTRTSSTSRSPSPAKGHIGRMSCRRSTRS